MNRIRKNKIERVACYIRVSTQEQKLHGISLDAQIQKLTAYAKKHNLKIVEWYKDEGVSGRKLIRKRPELQRMIQDAEKGMFDRIIFIKLDRFFRSVAEYHECMKRIAPVIWTTTEEDYDLSTANGRMLVNMKLTIAEMEADLGSERVKLVNEYKASTGQAITGAIPFGFKIVKDPSTGKKIVVKDPEYADIVEDIIDHYLTHQSCRATATYLHHKHHITLSYPSMYKLLKNPLLCGRYRDNPNYCEAYVDEKTFERMLEIGKNHVKENTREDRAYIFSGLLVCPSCGKKLSGWASNFKRGDKKYKYKKYVCSGQRINNCCDFKKNISENVLERMMLANIEKFLEDAKLRNVVVEDAEKVQKPKYDIDEIHAEIDRLNYSWQKGRIRTVEQYEEQYEKLTEKLEKAEQENGQVIVKDYSKIESILEKGWKSIYENLEDEYKRAFWRSFIRSIELNWTDDIKEVTRVNFF
jgi:DNA invertase Pin-like site-specific DNA recombinase